MGNAVADLFLKSGPEGRRVGRRVPTPGLWFEWQPAAPKGRPRPLRRRGQGQHQARIVDLSITGARVVVDGAEPLLIGTTVSIGLVGGAGTCKVRRVEVGDDDECTYGVEFLWLDTALRDTIDDLVTGDRGSLDERWHRAR